MIFLFYIIVYVMFFVSLFCPQGDNLSAGEPIVNDLENHENREGMPRRMQNRLGFLFYVRSITCSNVRMFPTPSPDGASLLMNRKSKYHE